MRRKKLAARSAAVFLALQPLVSLCRANAITAGINLKQTFQTMDGWGASMVNFDSANATSVYTSDAYRTAFRDLGLNILRVQMTKDVLTSTNSDGSRDYNTPIALDPTNTATNIAKMNFGVPEISNFGSMAAWLSKNALEPGRVQITGASWSPPNWMKTANPNGEPNGVAYATVTNSDGSTSTLYRPYIDPSTGNSWGGRLNVNLGNDTDRNDPTSSREQFGTYLGSWVKGFEQAYGVKMSAVSIQNEPNIETNYDSSSLTHADGSENAFLYGKALTGVADAWAKLKNADGSLALSGTKVMGAGISSFGSDENTMNPANLHGLTMQREMMATAKAYGVDNFTSIDSANFYNNELDSAAMKVLAAYYHGAVSTDSTVGSADAVRAAWADDYIKNSYFNYLSNDPNADKNFSYGNYVPGVEQDGNKVWFTESSEEDPTTWLKNAGTSSPGGAITVGLKIFDALVYSNAASYQYWQLADTNATVSPYTLLGDNQLSNPTASKKYDAFKQFSRYIRPGAIRVAANFTASGAASYNTHATVNDPYDSADSINIAAFFQPQDRTLTMVLLNMESDSQTVTIALPSQADLAITSYQVFTTDANDNFLQLINVPVINDTVTVSIGGDAVMTLYGVEPEPGCATIFSTGLLALLRRRKVRRIA